MKISNLKSQISNWLLGLAVLLVPLVLWAATNEVIVIVNNADITLSTKISSDLMARTFVFRGAKGTTNNTTTVWIKQSTNEVGLPLLPGQKMAITVASDSRTTDWWVGVGTTNDGVTVNLYH